MANKYGAKKHVIDGITFASKAEANRYRELKLLERAGEIRNLRTQPRYILSGNGITIKYANGRKAAYTADFEYLDLATNALVVEDVKGVMTEAASLRIAVFESLYNVKVTVIRKRRG